MGADVASQMQLVVTFDAARDLVLDRSGSMRGLRDGAVAMSYGFRECTVRSTIDYDAVESHMDPLDVGVGVLPKEWKAAVSWTSMPEHEAERWEAVCYSPSTLVSEAFIGFRVGLGLGKID